jgi:hypothetical protein
MKSCLRRGRRRRRGGGVAMGSSLPRPAGWAEAWPPAPTVLPTFFLAKVIGQINKHSNIFFKRLKINILFCKGFSCTNWVEK